jgi:hypothetical protein
MICLFLYIDSTYNKISMALSPSMQKLGVIVKFDAQKNQIDTENSWCDNIELFIDYDTLY